MNIFYIISSSSYILPLVDLDQPVIITSVANPIEGKDTVKLTCLVNTTDIITSYTWLKNNITIPNFTNDTFVIPGNSRSNSGHYGCAVGTQQNLAEFSAFKEIVFHCKYIVNLHSCSI